MGNKNCLKRNEGFTLIEIIAVLVILGILAAVAIPKFLDLQDEARAKALQGLVAAAQSQLSMEYAKELLNKGNAADAWSNLDAGVCANVSKDGYPTGTTLTCTKGDASVTIAAAGSGQTASGVFSDPNQ